MITSRYLWRGVVRTVHGEDVYLTPDTYPRYFEAAEMAHEGGAALYGAESYAGLLRENRLSTFAIPEPKKNDGQGS